MIYSGVFNQIYDLLIFGQYANLVEIYLKIISENTSNYIKLDWNDSGMAHFHIYADCISAFLVEFHDRWPLLLKLYYNFYDFNRKFNILGLISGGKDIEDQLSYDY